MDKEVYFTKWLKFLLAVFKKLKNEIETENEWKIDFT